MNAFDDARLIEARSMQLLMPFLIQHANQGRVVLCLKGPLAAALQKSTGDALFNTADGRLLSVEMKADNTYLPNIFLETWSNKNLDDEASHAGRGPTPGWMATQGASLLVYHRLQFDEVLIIGLLALQRWCYGHNGIPLGRSGLPGRGYDFPERRQRQRAQMNDTHGRCVPIDVIEKEVGLRRFRVQQLTLWAQEKVA